MPHGITDSNWQKTTNMEPIWRELPKSSANSGSRQVGATGCSPTRRLARGDREGGGAGRSGSPLLASGDGEGGGAGRSGSPLLAEESRGVVVAAFGHQLEVARRIRQRHPADVLAAQRDHLAVL